MPVLTRKILKEISIAFLLNLGLLSLITIMPFVDRFCKGLSFSAIMNLLPWIIISSTKFTIPLATIISCTIFSVRYKSDREYLAAASSAISLKAFTRTLLAFFFVVTSSYLYLSHNLIPQSWANLFEGVKKHSIQYLVNESSKGFPMVLSHEERLFIGGVEKNPGKTPNY